MKIKLTKKLASILNGVDVSRLAEGDAVDLPPRDAAVLLAEGWAVPAEDVRQHSQSAASASESGDAQKRFSR